MRAIREDLKMIHGFIPTIAIAVIGVSAARLGDFLRAPLSGRKSRNTTHAWSYRAYSPKQQVEWLPVRPPLRPCCDQA